MKYLYRLLIPKAFRVKFYKWQKDALKKFGLFNPKKYECPRCGWIGTEAEMVVERGVCCGHLSVCPKCSWMLLDNGKKEPDCKVVK